MYEKDKAALASYYAKNKKGLHRKKNWKTQIAAAEKKAKKPIKAQPVASMCTFPPGSDGKIEILADRFSRGLELFQPNDITWEQMYEDSR